MQENLRARRFRWVRGDLGRETSGVDVVGEDEDLRHVEVRIAEIVAGIEPCMEAIEIWKSESESERNPRILWNSEEKFQICCLVYSSRQ